ncbi:MAG: CinA family protein [Deltaproteobacteria bacterium]|nr:CinA family protein [Deltaproteobacteria bacterium]
METTLTEADLLPLAAEAVGHLKATGRTVAVAESCTGGLVSHLLTSVPGSSDVFRLGVVAYANDVKTALLGVSEEILSRFGAVSEPVAEAMARGALAAGRTDLAAATTGIAGPTGGTPDKPVGTVCFSMGSDAGYVTLRQHFAGSRSEVKLQAARQVLTWLKEAT